MSSARRPFVAGNWKLHKTLAESTALAGQLVAGLRAVGGAGAAGPEVAVAPVFTALSAVAGALAGSPIAIAAQDVYWEKQGAFTGEVGPLQLLDVGCRYVIVGHSERRQFFGETDGHVNRKTRAALEHGLAPIVCVGETLSERESGQAEAVVVRQLTLGLAEIAAASAGPIVVAYEPVWAIGTGRNAEPQDAQDMHARIRSAIGETLGSAVAERVRILYGGSVKPDNAKTLLGQADVDGALVGGASLTADSFCAIVAAAS